MQLSRKSCLGDSWRKHARANSKIFYTAKKIIIHVENRDQNLVLIKIYIMYFEHNKKSKMLITFYNI